jgi:hypothetical protein
MSDHDLMCISQEFLPDDLTRFCDCERVARIRADERGRAVREGPGLTLEERVRIVEATRADLRAKVEALPRGLGVIGYQRVLAVFDEAL